MISASPLRWPRTKGNMSPVNLNREQRAFDRWLTTDPRDNEGRIDLPDDTVINKNISSCCGAPYPTATTPEGIEVCMGCGQHMNCDCAACENERALDDDADAYFDRD